jgi:hypothetical protein
MVRSATIKAYSYVLSRWGPTEGGFEVAQSMGIALLGLVAAAVFAEALGGVGTDIINRIREELGLGGGG